MSGSSSAASPRLHIAAIDHARSLAILFAMFSHSVGHFAAIHYLFGPAGVDIFRIIARVAPAVFILLFGSLLELIYAARVRKSGVGAIAPRLLQRAVQCYLLYCATLLPLLLNGQATPGYALTCALLMGITPLTEILKFYALMCAVAPLIVWARLRWGLLPIFCIAAAVQLAWPLIQAIPSPPAMGGHPGLARLSSFLIGNNDSASGPSILQGTFFVLTGMVLGSLIIKAARRAGGDARAALPSLAMFGGALAVAAAAAWAVYYPDVTLRAFNNMSLRNANHPFYFLASSAGAILFVMLMLVLRLKESRHRWLQLSMIGKNSLFTFSFGNIIIYLMPRGDHGYWGSILLVLVTMVMVYSATASFDFLSERRALESRNGWVRRCAAVMQRGLEACNDRIVAMISPITEFAIRMRRAAATGSSPRI